MAELSSHRIIEKLRGEENSTQACALQHARDCGRKWAVEIAQRKDLNRMASVVEAWKCLAELHYLQDTSGDAEHVVQTSIFDQFTCKKSSSSASPGTCSCLTASVHPAMAAFIVGALEAWRKAAGDGFDIDGDDAPDENRLKGDRNLHNVS